MTFRLFFILQLEDAKGGISSKCLLYRYFPTVEKEVDISNKDEYVPLPPASELNTVAIFALNVENQIRKFLSSRDGCNIEETKPLFKLHTRQGLIWPCIMIDSGGIVFGGVLLVSGKISENYSTPFDFSNGFGTALEFLNDLSKYFMKKRKASADVSVCIADTLHYLETVCPFGRPRCISGIFADLLAPGTEGGEEPPHLSRTLGTKQPSPLSRLIEVGSSPNRQIQFAIRETITALQHEGRNGTVSDVEVCGVVTCAVDVGAGTPVGANADALFRLWPELTVTLSLTPSSSSSVLINRRSEGGHGSTGRHVLCQCLHHPCCNRTDYQATQQIAVPTDNTIPAPGGGQESLTLCFQPPAHSFQLVSYTVMTTGAEHGVGLRQPSPFITGFYQMQEMPPKSVASRGSRASLLLRLQLADLLHQFQRLEFSQFEVLLPFPNRPSIVDISGLAVNQGVLRIPENNRHVVVWEVGTRWLPHQQEVTLSGEIVFHNHASRHPVLDPFCIQHNVYAQLCFRVMDYTYSGLTVDPRSGLRLTDTTFKVATMRELIATEYRIWNSLGDSPAEHQQLLKLGAGDGPL